MQVGKFRFFRCDVSVRCFGFGWVVVGCFVDLKNYWEKEKGRKQLFLFYCCCNWEWFSQGFFMDGLICEFFVQFQNDGYDFGQDFIVFEDFLKYLVVYIIKCFLEVNDCQKYNKV